MFQRISLIAVLCIIAGHNSVSGFGLNLNCHILSAQSSPNWSRLSSERAERFPGSIRAGIGEDDQPEQHLSRRGALSKMFLISAAGLFSANSAHAFGSGQREIGEITASGIIFKDTIKITAFQDPKVEGVQLYVSDFQRPINERLAKDFFSDPSQASIGCAKTANIVRASKDIYKGKDGEEVFEQARSLLFKTLRVRRCADSRSP